MNCHSRLSRKTNLRQAIRSTQGKGAYAGARLALLAGRPAVVSLHGHVHVSSDIVVPEIAVAKVRKVTPFDKACYIGCGVTTGVAAMAYSAKVEAGANVVTFGLGGTSLNLIQGAKMVCADKNIGVDINPGCVELAKKFGMTHFTKPNQVENIVDHIVELTDGGANSSFECLQHQGDT